MNVVARTRGRHVLDPPRALQRVGDRSIHLGEVRGRRCAVVLAAGRARDLDQRVGRKALALDPDRVDRRVRMARRRDRLLDRALAGVVGTVGEDDDHAAGERIGLELLCSDCDRVEEGRAAQAVGPQLRQRGVGVELHGRERRQRQRPRAERDHSKLVGGLLRGDECARRRDRVGKGLPAHRLRAVDQRRDRLGLAEILFREPGNGLPVLGDRGNHRRARRRHD